MPKLARLYLDTARLGLMSPSAQLAARDFARLAGEGVSTLYFQNLLRGDASAQRATAHLAGLAGWRGIGGLKVRLRRLLGLPSGAQVLFASRTASLMRWAARELWSRCKRVLIPDTAWSPYVQILEEQMRRVGGQLALVSIRDRVQGGHLDAQELIAQIVQAFVEQKCEGLFLAAVSHDGVRLPPAELLTALRREANVRFAVIDGAQELAHVPIDLEKIGCDIWLAGAHKWLGSHQPLGIACLANPQLAPSLHESLIAESHDCDDPLLRFLLRLQGHAVRDIWETVNLAPLFSTWGALGDLSTESGSQTSRYRQRQDNAALVNQLAAAHGWLPTALSPTLATGIVVLTAQTPAIRQRPADELEAEFDHLGVTLTALGKGRLRLSMPAAPLDADQRSLLANALASVSGHRSPTIAERATYDPCANRPRLT
jgi:hypothetical protein